MIQRIFVKDEAYQRLREWILNGTLPPGEKLRDKDLAKDLGVSRTPIREAILRLEDEGFVQSSPNSSTRVTPIDFHNGKDLYSLVWTLEKLALEEAFPCLTEEHLTKMKKANKDFLEAMNAHDREKAWESDRIFHSIFIELSGNEELFKILSKIKHKLVRLDLYYFSKIKGTTLSYEQHQKIIEAIENKNLQQALKLLESNWRNGLDQLENQRRKICLKTN